MFPAFSVQTQVTNRREPKAKIESSLLQVFGRIVEILRVRRRGNVRAGYGKLSNNENVRSILDAGRKNCWRLS